MPTGQDSPQQNLFHLCFTLRSNIQRCIIFGIIKCEWVMQLKACHNTKYASVRVELGESSLSVPFSTFRRRHKSNIDRWKRLVLTKRLLRNRKTLDMVTRCWEQSGILDKHHVNKPRHFYRRKFKTKWLKREFPRYRQARGNAINNEMCVLIRTHETPFVYLFIDKIFWYFIDNV